jgi:hypothetical protein
VVPTKPKVHFAYLNPLVFILFFRRVYVRCQ